jgi:hypothetical protein
MPHVFYLVLFAWSFSRMILFRRCLVLAKHRYHRKIFEISKLSPNAKNHFDVSLKQICFEKFKQISWTGFHEG